jgi:hypothetical protein
MKTSVSTTLLLALVFGLVSVASAQLKAGSPEEAKYQKISDEKNVDSRLTLLLEFEKEFPAVNAKVLATIYMMTMDIYSEKDNKTKIAEYADKAIQKDPENVSALLRVSNNLAREKTNLKRAEEFAQKAKDMITSMRAQPTPLGQTDEQWKQWLDANARSADAYLTYARQLQSQ